LSAHGKLDRHALPPPAPDSARVMAARPVERLTPFQQRIAELFRDVLRVEHVGLHDDFFSLGGHSLMATQLVSRLRSTFHVELPLRAFFGAATVARVTEFVEEQFLVRQPSTAQVPPLRTIPRDGELPLSFAQQRLWVLDQVQPGGSHYNMVGALRMEGALNTEALRLALEHLVLRHEPLRATFALKDGQPVQRIQPLSAWPLPLTDLGAFTVEAREAETQRLCIEEAQRSFDLSSGPLLRTRLLRLSEDTHLLLLCMHHIVSDGWSMGVMVREVAAGYAAFASGHKPELPALPIQYVDFAAWQRQWLQGEVLDRHVAWWKDALAEAPRVLELPTDKPRPTVRSMRGALHPVHVPRELSQRLLALARQEGATPFMALFGVWALLLSRYSRQEDLLIGSPIAGRRQGELEGLVGFFVNTLVLRARVRPQDSFRALLTQLRETTLSAYEHQELPFEKLVEELHPQRDLSRGPLVQVIFSLQNTPAEELRAPGLRLIPMEVDNATARFELGLMLTETPDGVRGHIEYSSDLYTPDTAERLARQLHVLLESVVAQPDAPVSRLEVLPSDERRKVVLDWNDTQRPYPSDVTIAEHFARQAAAHPDRIAVECGEERLTYGQLDQRANRLAHWLREQGVGADERVAVCLERGLSLVVSTLAVLKAGGAYIPLDASYPAHRLALMLEDGGPRLMLTTRALHGQLALPDSQVPAVFTEELELGTRPTTAPHSGAGPRNLAYVIFTSGSTGRPKGVAIEHRGILRLVHSATFAGLGAHETWLLLAPLSFDLSVLEMWNPLLNGSRLVIYPADALATDLARLEQVVTQHGVTFSHFSPSLFAQIVEHRPSLLSRLRATHVGGDIIPAAHARRALELARIPVTNGYGPTECTVIATAFTLKDPAQVGDVVPIGPPLDNTVALVLDAQLQPVPIGVPGELYLGGHGLARGYVSRPDLTAERFVPNPVATTPGERLYRTGDLVRWRADGALDFLGRIDHQVKVRGFRIELAEVQSAVRALPGVEDSIVVVREDVPGDRKLVAYVASGAGRPALDSATLRAGVRARLPEYMVPSLFVLLTHLPTSPSGKVDRKALPAPDAMTTGRQGRFVEPSHPLETQLATLWARELGVERVGVHDHLFDDLGGTSLSVVRIAARLREAIQREVPVVWLFEHPTVHDLARRLAKETAPVEAPAPKQTRETPRTVAPSGDIAIIGMAGRFPGAGSIQEFWRNLREGVESITHFPPEAAEHLPGLPEGMELSQHPGFVPAGGVLEGIDRFDAAFFDLSLREAQWMDPQQRLFLQCAWTALEDAGIDPRRPPGPVSLYAGAMDSGYAEAVRGSAALDVASVFELYGTATHEALATKTSFKLGLTGESTMLYTACSTGLVAVHLASQNLRAGLSDVALAGATRIAVPQRTGYIYQEGMVSSPDGHCRPFDARAQGTVGGNGVACVVLKRVEDAVRDGDAIYAVIKSTATNNDGHVKSGYTAPSVQGQAAVITQALERAGVKPQDIQYVEAHGTATPLGDPIEVAALHRAYALGTEQRATIALASVKSNIGHLDTVAGLAGLIKAALSLHHGEIPASLHFEKPNPQIAFDAGPFFVNTALRPWPRSETPRRAAVSSFGIGGTNAHAILEESPMSRSGSTNRPHHVVVVSARIPEALDAASRNLAEHARANAETVSIADVAFTLATGRQGFEYRRAVVASDADSLVRQLVKPATPRHVAEPEAARERRVAFVFPGQGAQQLGMGSELYAAEPDFRATVDACLGHLDASLAPQVRALLGLGEASATPRLGDTRVALPALFIVEIALARLWMTWGIRPHAVVGHSFGEYAAACIAGVLPLEDALRLAVVRGELMQRLPEGAMLGVAMPEAQLLPLLSAKVNVAAVNAPDRCVASGPVADIERLQAELKRRGVGAVRMPAPHAFHSVDVEPLMPVLAREVSTMRRADPSVRYASGLTGTWSRAGELRTPNYWAEQMRQPVRFADAVGALLEDGCSILLEVGPGQDLTPLVRSCLGEDKERVTALASVRRGGATPEHAGLMTALGDLWSLGLEPEWSAVHAHEQRRRLHLPTYPFQEIRCWVESKPSVVAALPVAPVRSAPVPQEVAAPPPPPPPAPPPGREDAPRGDIEERLAALWRERLGLPFVGRDDNFLEIGGNSLMAAQLLNQVREAFGVQLPLAALFEAPTVAGIAERLEPLLRQAPAVTESVELPLVPLPRTGELPLSFVQERVWRLEQHRPGLSAYNIPFILRLEGDLDAGLLDRSLQEVVQRHEALRTTYDTVEGRPVQRFHPHVRIPMDVVELTGTPEEREVEALRLAKEDSARPYDLVNGPVIRATLLRLGARLHVLIGGIHHIVCDTLSIALFVHELGQLYGAFRQGRPSPLPPLPVQYADFGAWQRREISEGRLAEQEQWWRQRLAGMPRQLDVPTDRARPLTSPLTSVRMSVDFPPDLARELGAFGKREGFTSYMLVLAAWNTVLHRYSGQTDIIVGTPIGNRTRAELLPLIGYVAHSAAFRTGFADNPTFRELLGRVKQDVADAQGQPDVPFEYLVEKLIPGKDIGRGRMTDTVFVFHSGIAGGATALELTGVRGSLIDLPDAPVQWGATLSDLTLVLAEEPGRVHGALEYATELFDAPTVRRLVDHLQVLLGAALAAPDTRVSRLPLATPEEHRSWPRPVRQAVSPVLTTRLAEQLARSPDAVAMARGDESWTWRALAGWAKGLATRLRTLGVRTGDPVVLCLRATPEKLAAQWGALEAGAAVVALGPTDLGTLALYAPEGSVSPLVLTWRGMVTSTRLDPSRVVFVEELRDASPQSSEATSIGADSLAWILPAGAGQPAWTLDHRALASLFSALDGRLSASPGATWLAATESSAEQADLESLWALSRGMRVAFPAAQVSARLVRLQGGGPRSKALDLSLLYFANDEDSLSGPKYELLIEGAKFADAHGFSAVWTPERHFHSFGGLYPQPAVVAAALSTVTRNLRLRSGSVVLPLHDPLLVAEQWSVVDNLSGGRVDISVATGWHVHDFSFAPQNYEDRRNILLRNLETVRALWRGERIRRMGGGGVQVEVALRPRPVQRELPVWLTATSSPETFRLAGELGAGVLTGLMVQPLEELRQKVALYREAWRRNGHPGRGHITVMLHTFIGDDEQEVLKTVRQPLMSYFRSSAEITASLLAAQGYQGEIDKVSEADLHAILEHTFEGHAKQTGLIGTIESGVKRLSVVRDADVDEIACLIDFGLETPVVLEGLRRLAKVREQLEREEAAHRVQVVAEAEQGVDALLALARESGATLLHTSARLARTLAELPQAKESLGPVGALVLDSASSELASALHRAAGVEVLLAGGPREGALLPRAPHERVPEGLQPWILDSGGQPVPVGVVGELALTGAGLPRGLWRAEAEATRRLMPHPLDAETRLYRTGRSARLRADGRIEPVTLPAAKAPTPTPKPRTETPSAPRTAPAPRPAAVPGSTAIPRARRDRPLPLSFAQQRLWYLQQLDPSSVAYNNASNFRLTGALDVAALQAALDELVKRHEVLRTTYALTESGAEQRVADTGGLPMRVEDVPGATAEEREEAMLRRCREHSALPFDLSTGPVARALLFRLGAEQHVLSLVLHHVVSDAWCTMVLARELTVLYACFGAGIPSPLPPLPIQYADYAVWQREWLEGAVLAEQLRWWKEQLLHVPALELPTDRPRPAVQSYAGTSLRLQWPRELSEPLLQLGRREGATSFMVLLALFQTLLGRYSGQDDFAVGTPIAGRTRPEVEGIIGCFVNTLAFRSRLSGAPTFRELLGRVRQQALESYSRQDAPFERLMDMLQVPRDQSRTPVFQVVLNVLNTPEADASPQSLQLSGVDVSTDTSKFDLSLEVWEHRAGMSCRFEYATSLFDESTLQRMAEHLSLLARAVVASPDTPLVDLPLLTEAERAQVLATWNDTAAEYPRDELVHHLVEQQVAKRPEAVAVESEGTRLTYAELDAQANQLAHQLRAWGVGPESRVGVCLERSAQLVVTLLGVLKAGG
ncbi:amino acid adenylation domain-containing protein, partial [Myxococcaceae bacterium JPH2]|nr:amino acid adenylation domain-containing protein [Myxococcaceae bacterium JPH2]